MSDSSILGVNEVEKQSCLSLKGFYIRLIDVFIVVCFIRDGKLVETSELFQNELRGSVNTASSVMQ